MSKIIYAVGLDADGHIYHKAYRKDPSEYEDKAIRHNAPLLEYIRRRAALLGGQGDEVEIHICVFSRRQSQWVDFAMSIENNTGLFFRDIQIIAEHLGAKLEKVLLADFYGGPHLPEGHSFDSAVNDPSGSDPNREHPAWCDDNSKLTILYPHLHKLAKENPTTTICYDALDDDEIILDKLSRYCAIHSSRMFPKIVKEVLFGEYKGQQVDTRRGFVSGGGIIDANYRETVLEMAGICRERVGMVDVDISEISIDACRHIHPDLLTKRQAFKFPVEPELGSAEAVIKKEPVASYFTNELGLFKAIFFQSRLNRVQPIEDDIRDESRPSAH